MAASNIQTQLPTHEKHPSTHAAGSPPTRRDLASWWSGFIKKTKKEEEAVELPSGIFGVPLATSIKYANVAISLTNAQGESYTYGYVPIVIAKCGVFLKEKGTEVHGIFRLPGSAKRIKELQATFDSQDRYGKGLDWTGYTVHDAGSIFRRYINSLPEPVIPLDFYEQYRDPIRHHQREATGDPEAPADPSPPENFDHNSVIASYQKLIKELPPLNRQLLLYLLDLLAVFSSKSETNGMDSFNLSAVFQPGILSHPKHDLVPQEYKLSQNVLVYLILNQDHFLVGMSGTEADEKTVNDVQRGPQHQPQPHTPCKATHAGLGRSASNASAGADSLRKAGFRRGASMSSKHSNLSGSMHAGSPAPSSPLINSSGGGVHRSNTVPSKRSSAVNSPRLSKVVDVGTVTPRSRSQSPAPTSIPEKQTIPRADAASETTPEKPVQPKIATMPSTPEHPPPAVTEEASTRNVGPEIRSNEQIRLRTPEQGVTTTITSGTPTKDRKSFFTKSPTGDGERKDSRQPNKLKKKSRPTDPARNISAQSSSHSLPEVPEASEQHRKSPKSPPALAPIESLEHDDPKIPTLLNTDASAPNERPPRLGELDKVSSFHVSQGASREPSPAVRTAKSPAPSAHSGLVTEESDGEQGGNGLTEKSQKRRSRWRLSSAMKHEPPKEGTGSSRLGSTTVPEEKEEPVPSGSPPQKPRKSATEDSQHTSAASAATETSSAEKEHEDEERERKGLFRRIKAKVHLSKEERKEREAEKERAKSPRRSGDDHAKSKQSLNAIVSAPSTAGQAAEAKNQEAPKEEELR